MVDRAPFAPSDKRGLQVYGLTIYLNGQEKRLTRIEGRRLVIAIRGAMVGGKPDHVAGFDVSSNERCVTFAHLELGRSAVRHERAEKLAKKLEKSSRLMSVVFEPPLQEFQ